MAPIATVGFALSGGIIVVYILTMAMVPNLTLLLDLRKPKHPPLPVFDAAVKFPSIILKRSLQFSSRSFSFRPIGVK